MRKILFRAFVLSVSMCAGWLGTSRAAIAADQTISILGLEPAAGAPDAVANGVTEALRQRVTSTSGYRLVQGRDLVEVKLVFSCPDEAPSCMTQAAQSIGASKMIFGNVQPVGMDAYLITLKLLDADRGVVETWTSEQIAKTQTTPVALRGPVQKWFAALTGQTVPGSIKVTGGVIGAAVWLDGAQAGLMGNDGLTIVGVSAGAHQVVVSKIGYEKFERNVNLASGATERVAVQLKSIQGAEAPSPAPSEGGLQTTPPDQESAGPPARTGSVVGGFALLGVGIAATAFGAYSSYKVSDVNSKLDPYRRYPCASGEIACTSDGKTRLAPLDANQKQYVKDQQNTGDTYTTLQWVGYGMGAAALVGGTLLLIHGFSSSSSDSTESSSRGSNLVVMPSFAPGSAGAMARLTF